MARQVKGANATSAPVASKPILSTFDTLYYRRQVSEEDVPIVLQSHAEGSSLRGSSRISGLSYNTVASIVQAASQKGQMVRNAEVQAVDPDAIAADEMWSICP